MDQKLPPAAAEIQADKPTLPPQSRRRRFPWGQVPIHLVLAVMVVLVMLPFLWMAVGSFKTYPDLINNPNRLPDPFTVANYQEIFGLANFTRAFKTWTGETPRQYRETARAGQKLQGA